MLKLGADIIRKLAIEYPECTNGLIRSCKTFNRWITDDTNTFTQIKEIFSSKLYDDLQYLLLKFFSPDLRHIYTNSTNNHNAMVAPTYSPTHYSYLENLKVSTKGATNGFYMIGGTGLYIKLTWNINQIECIDYQSFPDFYSLFENSHQRQLLKKIGKSKQKFMKLITIVDEIDEHTDEMLGILSNLEHVISKGRNHWYKKNDDAKDDALYLPSKNNNNFWPNGFIKACLAIFVSALILGKAAGNMRKYALLGLSGLFFMCMYTIMNIVV